LPFLSKEQKLIQLIKAKVGEKYIGDDCAILPGGLLVSADSLVAGTHFLLEKITLEDLGWKALAVNLSDIAAMAGKPRYAVVSVTMPTDLNDASIAQLYEGLHQCAEVYKTEIVGGDLTSGPCLMIAITVIGEVSEKGCLRRGGARVGDVVVVTGDFGASRAGLERLLTESWADLKTRLKAASREHLAGQGGCCLQRHFRPLPRLEEAEALVAQTGSRAALMDTSDGLADALSQIAEASGVGMTIDLDEVPIREETKELAKKAGLDVIDWALYGGEDYELVGCLSDATWRKWLASDHSPARFLKQIGSVTSSESINLTFGGQPGPTLDLRKAFQHIPPVGETT
jgi:thiamine-monophosphate kinase